MTPDPHLCSGLGLPPDAERALARLLRSAAGRAGMGTALFSVDDHVFEEVQNEAEERLPTLAVDLLREALGNTLPGSYCHGDALSARVADFRDRVSDASRRGWRRYAVERLRPGLLEIAADVGRVNETPRNAASERSARALWAALDRPLFALRGLADSDLDAPGRPPSPSRDSLEKLVVRIPDTLFVAARQLRRLALGPMLTEPGEAEKFWEELLGLVSPSVALMRGLARAADRELPRTPVGATES